MDKKENFVSYPYGFVYVTTNLINGKRYIGQKKISNRRYDYYDKYLGSGKILINAIKLYGAENFEKTIISFAYSQDELDQLETELILFFDAANSDDYYNISLGQTHNGWELKTDEEKKEIISRATESRKKWRQNLTEEEKKTISEKCKKNCDWNNMSDIEKENKKSLLRNMRIKEKNPFYHKKHTEETKIKMSKGHERYLESGKHHIAKKIKIIINDEEYIFLSKRKAYLFLKDKNLIFVSEDSFRHSTAKNKIFDNFKYEIL